MTVTLRFGDDERSEAMLAFRAGALHGVLWDFDEWLREQVKYAETSDAEQAVYQKVREELYRCLGEHGVELDE